MFKVALIAAVLATAISFANAADDSTTPTEEFVIVLKNVSGTEFSSSSVAYKLLIAYGRPRLSGEIVRYRRLTSHEPKDYSQIWMTYKFTPSLGDKFIADTVKEDKPSYYTDIGILQGGKLTVKAPDVAVFSTGALIFSVTVGDYVLPIYLEPFWYFIIGVLVAILSPIVEVILNAIFANGIVEDLSEMDEV